MAAKPGVERESPLDLNTELVAESNAPWLDNSRLTLTNVHHP